MQVEHLTSRLRSLPQQPDMLAALSSRRSSRMSKASTASTSAVELALITSRSSSEEELPIFDEDEDDEELGTLLNGREIETDV